MNIEQEHLWGDYESEDVYIRDKWQFGLKSEFFPHPGHINNQYIQEFYFFVPNSLQINRDTYTKEQFYLDLTSLIRYKTPELSFEELFDESSGRSPLTRLNRISELPDTPDNRERMTHELKLLANIVRSLLRREVKQLKDLYKHQQLEGFAVGTRELCLGIKELQDRFRQCSEKFLKNWNDPVFYQQWLYIEEFIDDAISHYLTGLLETMRRKPDKHLAAIDELICSLLLKEKRVQDVFIIENLAKQGYGNTLQGENIVYRLGLLNKFVLDALQLNTNRQSINLRFQNWIGALSAGVAMLLYFSLYVWLGGVFLLNSLPFIILTVIIYILKDRIKEWLRLYSYQHASRWFPDFITEIRSANLKHDLGKIKESFSIIEPERLSPELRQLRNLEFHTVLETYQRPETVLFYKRIVEIKNPQSTQDVRRRALNIIFRFNIQQFLRKASDPYETLFTIDPASHELLSAKLPKVYHLNLIIRSTFLQNGQPEKVELKKLRLIIDKNGIKRIEHISG